ncbi:MAG TPA: DUF4147 domain-containing protein [Polyangiaceae bacterium]|nr:DUF4147 domain-containing protein [Polyangiaceae bacterium]
MSAPPELDRILGAALAAADPGPAVASALADPGALGALGRAPRVAVFALGKAAHAMARAALGALGPRASGGLVVAPAGLGAARPPLDLYEAPHPLPDGRSLAAGAALLARARGLGPGEGALVLLSGGASSLAEVPAPGLALADLRRAHELFLQSGLAIDEVNALRRALSGFKGGRLGAAFGAAPFATLVLSDVVRGGPEAVGSGPTAPAKAAAAGELVALARRAGLWGDLPPAARALLERPPPPPAFAPRPLVVVADVGRAARAAAREAEALGYTSTVMSLTLEGEARAAGDALARAALARRAPGARRGLVWGGETTVRVRGRGKGGRNQEVALAAALALEGRGGVRLLAAATDGVDGPTDAAGAWVDGATAGRARAAGLDPRACLRENDAYAALDAAGALVRCGPTGTNVNDVTVALVDGAPGAEGA